MKSLQDKLKEKKTNKIEQAEKIQTEIKALVAKLEESEKVQKEQRIIISDLSARLDDLRQKEFCFDNYTANEIKELKNALNKVSIPSEVRLRKEIDFSEITSKVILWFFLLALPIVGISMYIGIKGVVIERNAEVIEIKGERFKEEHIMWFYDYAKEMSKKNPKTHNSYLDKYPFPNIPDPNQ